MLFCRIRLSGKQFDCACEAWFLRADPRESAEITACADKVARREAWLACLTGKAICYFSNLYAEQRSRAFRRGREDILCKSSLPPDIHRVNFTVKLTVSMCNIHCFQKEESAFIQNVHVSWTVASGNIPDK